MEHTQYYCIGGLLDRQGHLDLRPGFLSDEGPETREDTLALVGVAFFDDREKLLGRSPLVARPLDGETLAIVGRVPFPPDTRHIRFYRQEELIATVRVPEAKPEIRLRGRVPDRAAGKQRIAWEASQRGGERLFFIPRYSNDDGESWIPVAGFSDRREHEFDLDQLPGGNACRFSVLATNGVTSAMAQSEKFQVAVKPCCALIQTPVEKSHFRSGESIDLRGNGFWREENKPEIENLLWTSSRDGEIGRGSYVRASGLTRGTHRITLSAGVGDRVGSAWIEIRVE